MLKALARELSILTGVLAERRKSVSRWATDYWIPVGVTPAFSGLSEGEVLLSDDNVTRYFMGVTEISCHATETEAYVHNFNSRAPALFVALRRSVDDAHPLPWFVHAVTASPYEAQDFEDSGEDIIERIAMPADIEATIKEFVDHYHREEEFRKRRRDRVDVEDQKFGKEPIFMDRQKPGGGKLDG